MASKVVLPNLKPTTKTISLRLPAHLLDTIKTVANAGDVPYQSLITIWLQEKVVHAVPLHHPRPGIFLFLTFLIEGDSLYLWLL